MIITIFLQMRARSKMTIIVWVTQPERPKGAKDEVKQARRAQSQPEGPQARSRGQEGP